MLFVTPQHLMLHQRHRHLAGPLAEALRTIKADGAHAATFNAAGYPPPETK